MTTIVDSNKFQGPHLDQIKAILTASLNVDCQKFPASISPFDITKTNRTSKITVLPHPRQYPSNSVYKAETFQILLQSETETQLNTMKSNILKLNTNLGGYTQGGGTSLYDQKAYIEQQIGSFSTGYHYQYPKASGQYGYDLLNGVIYRITVGSRFDRLGWDGAPPAYTYMDALDYSIDGGATWVATTPVFTNATETDCLTHSMRMIICSGGKVFCLCHNTSGGTAYGDLIQTWEATLDSVGGVASWTKKTDYSLSSMLSGTVIYPNYPRCCHTFLYTSPWNGISIPIGFLHNGEQKWCWFSYVHELNFSGFFSVALTTGSALFDKCQLFDGTSIYMYHETVADKYYIATQTGNPALGLTFTEYSGSNVTVTDANYPISLFFASQPTYGFINGLYFARFECEARWAL